MLGSALAIFCMILSVLVGQSDEANAATAQGWFNGVPICHADLSNGNSPAVHLTGKILKDGGNETRLTFPGGSSCMTTSLGETIHAEHKSRGG